jgi:hypothetical protein
MGVMNLVIGVQNIVYSLWWDLSIGTLDFDILILGFDDGGHLSFVLQGHLCFKSHIFFNL